MVKRSVMYRRAHILVDWDDRPEFCESCGRMRPEIKQLDTHHYRYEFSSDEVRAQPDLVKKNTVILCFKCHRAADAIRKEGEFDKDGKVRALIEFRMREDALGKLGALVDRKTDIQTK
jgi:hypothetical protein